MYPLGKMGSGRVFWQINAKHLNAFVSYVYLRKIASYDIILQSPVFPDPVPPFDRPAPRSAAFMAGRVPAHHRYYGLCRARWPRVGPRPIQFESSRRCPHRPAPQHLGTDLCQSLASGNYLARDTFDTGKI